MKDRIASPSITKRILTDYQFVFQKKYGQNFLIDMHVLDKIIRSADIGKDNLVIEIGPGIGSLTQMLAERAGKVIAVEIDSSLIPILKETLRDYENLELLNQDILQVDLKALLENNSFDGSKVKVVANLPYYITTPIIMNIFEKGIPIHSMTVMVQKEVAQRMKAQPGTKDYGALSLAVQYYSEPYLVANVPPNCFIPRPKVGSAVIKLTKYDVPNIQVRDSKLLFKLIRAAFNQRRKTLINSLFNMAGLNLSKDQIGNALQKAELDLKIRGEAISLSQFARLTDVIYELVNKNPLL